MSNFCPARALGSKGIVRGPVSRLNGTDLTVAVLKRIDPAQRRTMSSPRHQGQRCTLLVHIQANTYPQRAQPLTRRPWRRHGQSQVTLGPHPPSRDPAGPIRPSTLHVCLCPRSASTSCLPSMELHLTQLGAAPVWGNPELATHSAYSQRPRHRYQHLAHKWATWRLPLPSLAKSWRRWPQRARVEVTAIRRVVPQLPTPGYLCMPPDCTVTGNGRERALREAHQRLQRLQCFTDSLLWLELNVKLYTSI
ncbi:hypothetical protein B0H10DRAFT_2019435 [Mycena sp. CBHHK59/15]|nr:hypothetical protein B0H10DRAFT_2019435 [Mycena sp. CBHHK59/15]